MRLTRGLIRRVLIVSVICGLVGVLSSYLVLKETLKGVLGKLISELATRSYDTSRHEDCLREPAKWSDSFLQSHRVFAYDSVTLRSANPEAPPLDRELYATVLTRGAQDPYALREPSLGAPGVTIIRLSHDGECSILQDVWTPSRFLPPRTWALLISSLLSSLAAAALGFGVLFRPLAGRIERLRVVTEGVGRRGGEVLPPSMKKDELDDVADCLAQAHRRILDDARSLEEQRRALQHHLDDVMHDLRTPLASLQLTVERALALSRGQEVEPMLRRGIDDLVYMTGLLSNLRLATQLQNGSTGALEHSSVELGVILQRLTARFAPFARARRITLELASPEAPLWVEANLVSSEQALANVIENAVAHGVEGGHVSVMAHAARGSFVVRVLDDGPGLPPAELPRLGERTFRSDEARQRDPKGSGLGLAITAEVCRRSGWELTFEPMTPSGLQVQIRGLLAPDVASNAPRATLPEA